MKAIARVVTIAINRIFSTEISSRAQMAMDEPSQTPMIEIATQGYFILFECFHYTLHAFAYQLPV